MLKLIWRCGHCGKFPLNEIASALAASSTNYFLFSALLLGVVVTTAITNFFCFWLFWPRIFIFDSTEKCKGISGVRHTHAHNSFWCASYVLYMVWCVVYKSDRPRFLKDNCMRLHLLAGAFFCLSCSFFHRFSLAVVIVCHQKQRRRRLLWLAAHALQLQQKPTGLV